ncbi:MAG TPA: nitroreductase [Pseudogracilibacillus sp.]|nr:nitroreductase [Pseudogracilibacillus sp.]
MSLNSNSNIAEIIRNRRAVKKGYNDKTVEEQTIRDLLEDAVWAPTHGMRQPWRFVFIPHEEIPAFAKKVADTYPEEKQENREEYMNEPNAILAVIMEEPEIQKQWEENYGATASMIQNLWLLAWEQNLGMVWKTNPHIYEPEVQQELNVQENEKLVGLVHLGYFDRQPIRKHRISVDDKFSTYNSGE